MKQIENLKNRKFENLKTRKLENRAMAEGRRQRREARGRGPAAEERTPMPRAGGRGGNPHAEGRRLSELRSRPVRWYRYNCDRLSMRVKIKETHAAQTASAYNIHRISDKEHSCSISFWGSFTSPFSRNIINIIDICIHMNLPDFISFTYEKLRLRRIRRGWRRRGVGFIRIH